MQGGRPPWAIKQMVLPRVVIVYLSFDLYISFHFKCVCVCVCVRACVRACVCVCVFYVFNEGRSLHFKPLQYILYIEVKLICCHLYFSNMGVIKIYFSYVLAFPIILVILKCIIILMIRPQLLQQLTTTSDHPEPIKPATLFKNTTTSLILLFHCCIHTWKHLK